MKIAELNIGLRSKSLGEITPETVLSLLKAERFNIITFRLQESVSLDGNEICLACKVILPDDWQAKLAIIADYLGQDCIAVVGFIGARPYDNFNGLLWVPGNAQESPVEFETEERLFRATRNGDNVETWELVLSSPDTGEDLQEQAFNGLQDGGILDA